MKFYKCDKNERKENNNNYAINGPFNLFDTNH